MDSFLTLYDQHVEQVYRYHLARIGCPAEAEDLTAETFRAALEAYGRLRPGEPPAAWLFGIARHKLLDHLRRVYRREKRLLPLEAVHTQAAPGPLPEDAAAAHLEQERITAALSQLSGERGEALALHYYGGLPLVEVGHLLGKSEEAAKKLVQRGLAELRERLKDSPEGTR